MLPRPFSLYRIVAAICALALIYLYVRRDQQLNQSPDVPLPPPVEVSIPKIVHQLLISMPKHPISTHKPNKHSISWMRSGWKLEYWSEDACLHLAKDLNTTYMETFQKLPTAVLKSDFCRYLIMFGKGGVYSDLDVHLMKPLPWQVMGPAAGGEGPPNLIIGLEGDGLTTGLPRSPQFVQWTMASVPAHPAIKIVLDQIAERTPSYHEKAANAKDDIDIMSWTGPSVWTDAILSYLDCNEEQLKNLRDLKEAIRIKDVVLLPKRSFAIIQGQDHTSPDILVKHYFSGTWKKCIKKEGWINKITSWGC